MNEASAANPLRRTGPSLRCFAKFRMDLTRDTFGLSDPRAGLFDNETWDWLQAAARDLVLVDFELRRTEVASYLQGRMTTEHLDSMK